MKKWNKSIKKTAIKIAMKTERASSDVFLDSLEKFKKIFPQFVKDGEVDFDGLKDFFDKDRVLINSGGDEENDLENTEGDKKEKYGLSFAGKSRAFRAIREKAVGTITPQKEESKDWDKTENVFIEGDNLEVLKLLQRRYREKIKMIYIDPPYNTGKDFVYKDNFSKSIANYYEQTGQSSDGVKMIANTEKNGRFHSDWLTMIYPRLFLARNLLQDDGVIFISIDDNEVANLRLIMDEIFGEENFVGEMIKKTKSMTNDSKTGFNLQHENLIIYSRYKEKVNLLGGDKDLSNYTNSDNDPNGDWVSSDPSAKSGGESLYYEIKNPYTGKSDLPPQGRYWGFSKKTLEEYIKTGKLKFKKSHSEKERSFILKRYKNELKNFSNTLDSIYFTNNEFMNQNATKELRDAGLGDFFEYPKGVNFLKKIILHSNNSNDNSTILDFFAGSGTTAHSVMSLNSEDGGNRKYILVQIPEITDEGSEARKAGYKNIAEIARERIRRAGELVKKEMKEKGKSKEEILKLDTGFKAYKLTTSNYREWGLLTDENSQEDILKQSKLFMEKPLVDNFDENDVVYEIMLKEGFDLNSGVEKMKGGLNCFVVSDKNSDEQDKNEIETPRKMYITFARKITKETVFGLGLKENDIFVCLDSALDDTNKINIAKEVNLRVI